MVELEIEHPRFKKVVKLGLLEELPEGIQMQLGNDITSTLNGEQNDEELYNAIVTRSMTAKQQQTESDKAEEMDISNLFENKSENRTDGLTDNETIHNDSSTDIIADNIDRTSRPTEIISLDIDREALIALQKADRKLLKLNNLILTEPYPATKNYYYRENDILMHCKYDKKRDVKLNRIVLPTRLIPEVMKLA